MSAEETVFCIPGLRLLILSYFLENKKENKRVTCKNYIKQKIENKFDTIIFYFIQKLYGNRISIIR
jgi:hypothetical protein